MSNTAFLFWFAVGLAAALPLLFFAQGKSLSATRQLLGCSLIVAALIYVGFALVAGDRQWLLIELVGVFFYGSFYYLASRVATVWLALGWGLHVAWDLGLHLFGGGSHIVPDAYAVLCLSFDFAMAGYLLYRLKHESVVEPVA